MGRVIYLNSWLDCPDVILKRNYAMQEKISEARIHFFYRLREEGKTESQTLFFYSLWIQRNRSKIRLEKYENFFDSGDSTIPPAS
jgi:hypothetical protein